MPKLMIVDDDRTTVGLLKMLLEMDGFEVLPVPLGTEAIQKAHEQPPDIFMIDRHLADMDGLTLIQQLRQEAAFAQTPIVMASGKDMEREAMQAGANLFLVKPLEPETLAETLKSLL